MGPLQASVGQSWQHQPQQLQFGLWAQTPWLGFPGRGQVSYKHLICPVFMGHLERPCLGPAGGCWRKRASSHAARGTEQCHGDTAVFQSRTLLAQVGTAAVWDGWQSCCGFTGMGVWRHLLGLKLNTSDVRQWVNTIFPGLQNSFRWAFALMNPFLWAEGAGNEVGKAISGSYLIRFLCWSGLWLLLRGAGQ